MTALRAGGEIHALGRSGSGRIIMGDEREIRYYSYDWDWAVALVSGDTGDELFRCRWRIGGEWEFLIPLTELWARYHQDIFFAHHYSDPFPKDLICRLKVVPPVPEYKLVEWADNFKPEGPLTKDRFPKFYTFLHSLPGGLKEKEFFFLLDEDHYETICGDGKMLLFSKEVFFDRKTGEERLNEHNRLYHEFEEKGGFYGGPIFYLKSVRVKAEGESLVLEGWAPRSFEHYRIEEILEYFEKELNYNRDTTP